ncbi:MAG: hypothetical protein J5685_10220 [Clostridiales bacterium]|nr:hypothetical protein [Clostridiales bacterium]
MSKELMTEQLLRGISSLCAAKDDCSGCPFYTEGCVFEEPKPRTWFDEGSKADTEQTQETEASEPVNVGVSGDKPAAAQAVEASEDTGEKNAVPKPRDDSDGTWIVSTTMGSVLSKYVYICSKCGYKKESYFSITPTSFCPECSKRKEGN